LEEKKMLEIKCPRCGTINVGVSPDAPCRQCGTILNAPLSALDEGAIPPSSAANGADRFAGEDQTEREPIARGRVAAPVSEK
jgi:uncharacterized OB-fold protein